MSVFFLLLAFSIGIVFGVIGTNLYYQKTETKECNDLRIEFSKVQYAYYKAVDNIKVLRKYKIKFELLMLYLERYRQSKKDDDSIHMILKRIQLEDEVNLQLEQIELMGEKTDA